VSGEYDYDVVVIGSGPAGQKAAVQAAKTGRRVAMIERDRVMGGACVHRGTIPSKTLRENALNIARLRNSAELFDFKLRDDLEVAALMGRMRDVLKAHAEYIQRQISRNEIRRLHGKASFEDAHRLRVRFVDGHEEVISSEFVVIATGSYPRKADGVPIDHEHVFDSDSILSMEYLPRSLTVLGGGVIATEYASIFATLGVEVTMIDRYGRPVGFLDPDLTDKFLHAFTTKGGHFVGGVNVESVSWDGISSVVTKLEDGQEIRSEKLLSAAGRIADVRGMALENAGLELSERGTIEVDAFCRTRVDNIFAAGDVIGPPSLASASMEQGRRASRAACGSNASTSSRTRASRSTIWTRRCLSWT